MFRRFASAPARRALIEDIEQNKRSWIGNGVAALAVSVLGLGAAGAVMVASNGQTTDANAVSVVASAAPTEAAPAANATPKVEQKITPGVKQPSAFQRKTEVTSRSTERKALQATPTEQAKDRSTTLGEADLSRAEALEKKAAAARDKALAADAKSTRARAEQLLDQQTAVAQSEDATGTTATGDAVVTGDSSKGSLPISSGFTIAARFGAVGAWSRYHTGIDFSAPIGTPIHAIAAGVITHAGPGGGAGGWAGNYVTVKHSNGTQTLYAHQSVVSVSVGQQVNAGDVIGHIGMTGRSFGPHVHVELYPVGVEPGDVYRAIDPAPWMNTLGLSF